MKMMKMGEGPGDKTGKIKRTYDYGRDENGNRTALAELDTGEKDVPVTWDKDKAAWSVFRGGAKEGQQFDMKESVEIAADRDRSKTAAKGMGLGRSSTPSPTTVDEKPADYGRDLNRSIKDDKRKQNIGHQSNKSQYKRVTLMDSGDGYKGTVMSFNYPGMPDSFPNKEAYNAWIEKYKSENE